MHEYSVRGCAYPLATATKPAGRLFRRDLSLRNSDKAEHDAHALVINCVTCGIKRAILRHVRGKREPPRDPRRKYRALFIRLQVKGGRAPLTGRRAGSVESPAGMREKRFR